MPFDAGEISDDEIGGAANDLFSSLGEEGDSPPR
jgi:hypothetical protein